MTSNFSDQKRRSSAGDYDAPEECDNIGENTEQLVRDENLSNTVANDSIRSPSQPKRCDSGAYDIPQDYSDLNETASVPALGELSPRPTHDQPRRRSSLARHGNTTGEPEPASQETEGKKTSKLLTEIYSHSYLVLFAILGTLARLGLTALTRYSGTPVIFNTIWANFTGSLVMGFLAEDRKLFRNEWGTPTYDDVIKRATQKRSEGEDGFGSSQQKEVDLAAAKRAHLATKKTIPLYIGLATGFCGSFTTFSSFIKDVFLALSNELATPGWPESPTSRNGGYSFMAMLAVIITTVSLSLSGLFVGAHLAVGLERITPSIPFSLSRRVLDPLGVLLGWGCWLGAVLLAIFSPHEAWRGQAIFALVFAPLGCLLRFYLSLHLNGKMATFPVGTFSANVLGTVLLGMAWDLAHVPLGGIIGCQVLQGIEDGFCGCLTTISTWVAELVGLRRRSSWVYGTTSVVVSLVMMIAIMGGLRWSDGYSKLSCKV
jgi:fluoride ion exporter CrcB/FEX